MYLGHNATVAFYWVKRFDGVAETIVTSEHVETYQYLLTLFKDVILQFTELAMNCCT